MSEWYVQPIYGEGEGWPEERGRAVLVEAESAAAARDFWWLHGGGSLSCLDWVEVRPAEEVPAVRLKTLERLR